ncbi:MAG: zinc ABC transporter substrate-binding protein [Dehalococcoidia bacterium]|nr:zinc ABC transporter substrate-binding protein [Dehalococcoidia bacterium]
MNYMTIIARGVLILPAILLMSALACGGDPTPIVTSPPVAPGLLRVASTVSPITSIVENIGGTRIHLEGIVPEGTNSHTFKPAPSVARILADTDLIVLNGLFLEEPTLEMAGANKNPDTVVLLLGDRSISREDWQFDFSFPESQNRPNPHLWTDPMLALRYAELVRDELVRLDPSNAEYYNGNFNAFQARIIELDRGIRAVVQTIPIDNRKLLTYHDSWAYFAKRYGMTVIGAAQPSDFSEPSAQEVAHLIDQVKEFDLPSVFGSEVFPSDVLETIARESGAKFVDQLRDDDLPGNPGDPRHSYLGLMLQNMEIMIPALGGDAEALAQFDPSHVFEGDSRAIYPQ